ncbi:ubiquitin-conjugating enzyme E2 Z-like [Frankliniella occidentalis]|uniref:Ubiquitin-conjugating enzyme E2 Z n=1 Tax=Frankliniella occidentalis TaxID=133901 RepID=A0A9C6X902_FRAOC|nr:ubiquitin-conjugating enzyme E2 Z-like [Frankliniella occidentalis]
MKSPPYGIFGVPDENDFQKFHAIITGPDETPYEKGFFYFILTFPDDYPLTPPAVQFMTTGGGTVRMNPNLYACGKVCLSLLGTWHGPSWSPAHTLTSVLISIQTLLNKEPYCNEPGHETEKFPGAINQYNEVIMHETLRVAVVGMVRNDTALTIPIALELHMQQQFIRNIEFYLCRATQKSALSGNPIKVKAIVLSICQPKKMVLE